MSTCRGMIRSANDAWQHGRQASNPWESARRGSDTSISWRKQLLYPGALPSGEAYEVDEANQESPCESMVIVVIGHACADHLTTTM